MKEEIETPFPNDIINYDKMNEEIKGIKSNIINVFTMGGISSGFLCKAYIEDNKPIPLLITCNHVIDSDYVKENPFVFFTYLSHGKEEKEEEEEEEEEKGNKKVIEKEKEKEKEKIIKKKKKKKKKRKNEKEKIIDLKLKRNIYLSKKYDIAMIEILEDDKLDIYSFLEMDNSININNPQILYKRVYLLHHPKGIQIPQFSQGHINNLLLYNNVEFTTDFSTEPGSSGSPIIDYEKNLVIGIHTSSNKNNYSQVGKGIILKAIMNEFSKVKREEIEKSYIRLYPYPDEMDMIYSIPQNASYIQVLGKKFHEPNNGLCLIYNRIKFPFSKEFKLSNLTEEDIQKGEVKITLKGINHIKNMNNMFSQCYELKKVIATGTDMSNVETMEEMFEWCTNLEELSNTSDWNLESVTNIKCLFYKCIKLTKIPGMYKWDPPKLDMCKEIFFGCIQSLRSTEVEQIEKWKNVSKNIKKYYMKGHDIENWGLYMTTMNLGGTLKYFFKQINKKFFENIFI